jgi:hypothetical protein
METIRLEWQGNTVGVGAAKWHATATVVRPGSPTTNPDSMDTYGADGEAALDAVTEATSDPTPSPMRVKR